jgi:hypothetical protein
MTNQPNQFDAVLSNQSLTTTAVLGGIEGVRERYRIANNSQKQQVLVDAVKYEKEGRSIINWHFDHPDYSKFFVDMVKAGYIPEIEEQRFYWAGPSVICNNKTELQDIIRKTEVNLVWDNSGKEGCVVYPAAYTRAKLTSLRLLMEDMENPEARSLAFGIALNLGLAEPMCVLAKNLLTQLETF